MFLFTDGESNESNGGFNLANFWDTLSWVISHVGNAGGQSPMFSSIGHSLHLIVIPSSFHSRSLPSSSDQAAKAVSQEATKLSLVFSKPPLPSQDVRLSHLWTVAFPSTLPYKVHFVHDFYDHKDVNLWGNVSDTKSSLSPLLIWPGCGDTGRVDAEECAVSVHSLLLAA